MWDFLIITAFLVGWIVGCLQTEHRIWKMRKEETKYVWVCPEENCYFVVKGSHEEGVNAVAENHKDTHWNSTE